MLMLLFFFYDYMGKWIRPFVFKILALWNFGRITEPQLKTEKQNKNIT